MLQNEIYVFFAENAGKYYVRKKSVTEFKIIEFIEDLKKIYFLCRNSLKTLLYYSREIVLYLEKQTNASLY